MSGTASSTMAADLSRRGAVIIARPRGCAILADLSTDVRVEIEIARPRAEVAAFMFEPRNDATWTSGVVAVRPLDEGRLRPGARVVRTAQFLGRRFDYQYEVAAAEGDR